VTADLKKHFDPKMIYTEILPNPIDCSLEILPTFFIYITADAVHDQ